MLRTEREIAQKVVEFQEAFRQADTVLIGAGAGLSASAGFAYSGEQFHCYFFDFEEKYDFHDMYSGGFYPFPTLEEHWAYWSRFIFLNRYCNPSKPVYRELASTKFTHLLRADTGELEYQETEKAVEQIKSEIAAQVRNMRQADSNIRKYIQEDIEELSKELEKKEQILIRLRQEKNGDAHMTEEIADMKKRLLSFRAFADGATPEVLVTLIQTLVERIYIVYDNEIAKCHVFVKGCAAEEYSELLGPADYISICAVFSLPASVCDCDRYRERHPYLRRRAAAPVLCAAHKGAGR